MLNDPSSDRWMVSGTNVQGVRTLMVVAGGEAELDVGATLHVRFAATRRDDGLRLTLSFDDGADTRLTVSRNGALVVPRVRIRAADGAVIAEEPLVPL